MFSNVMSAQPDSAYPGGCRKRKVDKNKCPAHLNDFEMFPHGFGNFKRQLLLRDVLTNLLVVRRQDLAVTLIKTFPSGRLVGLTFDCLTLRPGNWEREENMRWYI